MKRRPVWRDLRLRAIKYEPNVVLWKNVYVAQLVFALKRAKPRLAVVFFPVNDAKVEATMLKVVPFFDKKWMQQWTNNNSGQTTADATTRIVRPKARGEN